MGIIKHMEGDAGKCMSRCFGSSNDEYLNFMLQTTDCFLGTGKFVRMINFVADGWVNLWVISRFAIGDDTLG